MVPTAVNSQGDVVGTLEQLTGLITPFLYTNGTVYDLSAGNVHLSDARPISINDAGVIVYHWETAYGIVRRVSAGVPSPLRSVTIRSTPPGVAFQFAGLSYTTPKTFEWSAPGTYTVEFPTQLPLGGGSRHVFSRWADGSASATRAITLSTSSAALSYTAEYVTQHPVTIVPAAGGAVSASALVDGYVNAGTAITVQGTPAAGYRFTSFGGALGGSSNPQQLVVNGPVTISASFEAAPPPSAPLRFVAVAPCRVADTRLPAGSAPLAAVSTRDFVIAGQCGIPVGAQAYAMNVTVVPQGSLGYLTLWPAGLARPVVSTLNSFDGRIKANAAIVPAGVNGRVSVYVTESSHVILDVSGYFVPATDVNGLAFYPVSPCRLADTRKPGNLLGQMPFAAGERRTLAVLSSRWGTSRRGRRARLGRKCLR
jgi:hypothetical protein